MPMTNDKTAQHTIELSGYLAMKLTHELMGHTTYPTRIEVTISWDNESEKWKYVSGDRLRATVSQYYKRRGIGLMSLGGRK